MTVLIDAREAEESGLSAHVEVTTFRGEGAYADGRHPDSVEFHTDLIEDLRRRDFTINAMAIQVNPDRFGRLLDPTGGRADLERGIVRVLHNLSFVEDPTRVFRAVRFEARCGFRMDEHTEALARHALASGALEQVSPEFPQCGVGERQRHDEPPGH